MPRFSLIAACGLLLVNAAVATAYNKAAHMVSGAIAYHVLKADSPQALEKIVGLLNGSPPCHAQTNPVEKTKRFRRF